jgi:hypothetical protein
MRNLLIITLIVLTNYTFAQTTTESRSSERNGFFIGVGIGAGSLTLKTNDTTNISFSTTIPNIKVGYMVNKKLALFTLLPGANYKYNGKDRGFEAVIFGGQYWVKNNWWILGGIGFTFDAPAFYTVNDPQKASFYFGAPAITFATGYEVWHKGNFSLDLQYRIFIGKSNLPNNSKREGVSNMLSVGFNWY